MVDDREKAKRFRRARREQLRRSILIQTDTYNEILNWLDRARIRIMAALAGVPSEFESWRLGHLQTEVRRAMETFSASATETLLSGLDRSWAAGSDLVVKPLATGGIDLSGRLPALDPRLLLAMKSFQTDRIRDISTTTVNLINQELGQAVIGTQSPFDAARNVAVLMNVPQKRARSIVRTELGTVYSEAGQQRMEQARKLGVEGLQKQWRRSGKLHPRITHDLADGQIVDVDKPFLVGGIEIPKPRDPSIPAGERINCGCSSLPYMRHWRVSTPGARPYTAEELATSPVARQVEEVRAATPVLSAALSEERIAHLRKGLAKTAWGEALVRGERLYGLTDEEALALHAYSYLREEGGARAVNTPLRAGAEADSPYASLIAIQRRGLDRLPIITGEMSRFLQKMPSDLLHIAPDGLWCDKGFMSTTGNRASLETYFRQMPHELRVMSRTGRDFAALSRFPQNEVIFAPGTLFKVRSRSMAPDGNWTYWLEEVA